MTRKLFFLLLLFCRALQGADLVDNLMNGGVTVDLREPLLSNGVITTEKGGVIAGEGIRIQAKKIIYTRRFDKQCAVAEGDVIIEYCQNFFVGDKIEYDFLTKTGTLYNGRGAMYPWYFGGDEITLCPNGTYHMRNAYFTTSESVKREWELSASSATVTDNCYLDAKDLEIRILKFPIFQIKKFRFNLDLIFDTPVRYYVRVGGVRGTRFGIQYNLFTWGGLKTFIRLDYRIFRGPGGGFELHYVGEGETTLSNDQLHSQRQLDQQPCRAFPLPFSRGLPQYLAAR